MVPLLVLLVFLVPGNLGCHDLSKGCPRWAAMGRCESMPGTLLLHCKHSCDNCDEMLCLDQLDNCDHWATYENLCQKNASFMLRFCKRSCHACDEQLVSRSHRTEKAETTTPMQVSTPKTVITVTTTEGRAILPPEEKPLPQENCEDEYARHCPFWKEAGHCESNELVRKQMCRLSCGTCVPIKVDIDCVDHNVECSEWAGIGHCHSHPIYMRDTCPLSCGMCEESKKVLKKCRDKNSGCALWAKYGHCETNPEFMFNQCKESCGFCGDKKWKVKKKKVIETPEIETALCTDKNKWCFVWSLRGACERNPFYMLINCKLSCGACGSKDIELMETRKTETVKQTSSCKDGLEHCPLWAASGLCFSNTKVMQAICPLSCGICTVAKKKCTDRFDSCYTWSLDNQCEENPSFMKENCPKTCDVCPDITKTQTVDMTGTGLIHTIPTGKCKDDHKNCKAWSEIEASECIMNSGWMLKHCRKSCHNCKNERIGGTAECKDNFAICLAYAADGNCELLPEAMKISCRYSCGYCGACRDLDNQMCEKWKLLNMCVDNELWMRNACKKTCGFCDQ